MWKDFQKFMVRGNVVDLAVGFLMGAAFSNLVSSLVNDIIMPPIGLLIGRVDFGSLFINLSGEKYASLAEAQAVGAATINYGVFLNTVIEFVIVAFALFLLIKQVNRLQRQPEAVETPPASKDCPYCYSKIPMAATRCPNCTSQLGSGE